MKFDRNFQFSLKFHQNYKNSSIDPLRISFFSAPTAITRLQTHLATDTRFRRHRYLARSRQRPGTNRWIHRFDRSHIQLSMFAGQFLRPDSYPTSSVLRYRFTRGKPFSSLHLSPFENSPTFQINAVVISHNHYDHLDYPAVHALHARFGDDLRFYVPMGLRGWFEKYGITNVVELTWWQTHTLRSSSSSADQDRSIDFVFLPAQHWSLRSGFDRNQSLWGGWGVIGRQHRFYFGGDTGYCPEFKNIGAHYGPFDISAIPIGCYSPRHFMCSQHVNPADAVQIHQDIRSKFSLGIHWGTYEMGSIEVSLPFLLLT